MCVFAGVFAISGAQNVVKCVVNMVSSWWFVWLQGTLKAGKKCASFLIYF
jgi:hypothetical protein